MNKYEQRMRELGGQVIADLNEGQLLHVPEAELQKAERELGYALPADYREFVRDYGGIQFDLPWFYTYKDREFVKEGSIDGFYGVMM